MVDHHRPLVVARRGFLRRRNSNNASRCVGHMRRIAAMANGRRMDAISSAKAPRWNMDWKRSGTRMNDPLADLDKMLGAAPTDTATEEPFPTLDELPPYVSPTLQRIDAPRRPNPSTMCEGCPASLWFASETEVRCFCRTMHLFIWTAEEPNALTECDGEVAANLERQAQFESRAPTE